VKVPWRAVSVYFAATGSIQQSTQKPEHLKIMQHSILNENLSTPSIAPTTSFRKVHPSNANAKVHSLPLHKPAPPSLILKPVPQSLFPNPSAQSFYRRNLKLTVSTRLLPLETYDIESYRNLEASSLRSWCPRSLNRKKSREGLLYYTRTLYECSLAK
jgi:hypothetical protein